MSIPSTCLAVSLWALPLLMLSCQEINPEFCTGHPDDVACSGNGNKVDGGSGGNSNTADAGIDASRCTSNAECTSPTPICDMRRSVCVQCIAVGPSTCGGTAPVCGDDGACRGCAADAECESLTCLPGGSCEAAIHVLYAAADGNPASSCTPTAKCSVARAVALIDGIKTTIRLDPGQYTFEDTLLLSVSLRVVGRDAVLDRVGSGIGATLGISGRAEVELDYLTVQGGDGVPSGDHYTGGSGISCDNATLTAREINVHNNDTVGIHGSRCTLAITHSRIELNRGFGFLLTEGSITMTRSVVSANPSGGIQLMGGTFDLENNFIIENGGSLGAFGGMLILNMSGPGPHVFDFNTVAFNYSEPTIGYTPGVDCEASFQQDPGGSAGPLVFTNNIVFSNVQGNAYPQVSGNCNWKYSNVAPIPPLPPLGLGNVVLDPLFVDPQHSNFHLQAGSPMRGLADPAATLAVDIDGEVRPQGAGRDMGADEIK